MSDSYQIRSQDADSDFNQAIEDIFYDRAMPQSLPEPDQTDDLAHDIEVLLESVKRHKIVVFPLQYCPHSDRAIRVLENKYGKQLEGPPETNVWQSYLVPIKYKDRVRSFLDRLLAESKKRNRGADKEYTYTFPAVFVDGRYIGGADDLERLMRGGK